MRLKTTLAAIMIALLTAACAQNGQYGKKQTFGALGGAAAGGLLGAQIGSGKGQLAATAAGVLLGALIGSEIGRSMDDVDRLKADRAYNQAVPTPRSARASATPWGIRAAAPGPTATTSGCWL